MTRSIRLLLLALIPPVLCFATSSVAGDLDAIEPGALRGGIAQS